MTAYAMRRQTAWIELARTGNCKICEQ